MCHSLVKLKIREKQIGSLVLFDISCPDLPNQLLMNDLHSSLY